MIDDLSFGIISASLFTGLWVLLLASIFRKSHFHYRIHLERAEVNYQLYVPRYMEDFLKGMALIVIVGLLGLAVFLGSAVLLGPVAMVIIAALRLLSWEPPPAVHETSLPWYNYQHVTIDRYFLIIAVHVDEEQCGFVARLPDKGVFEQYLAFLRTVLPPTAQYREGIWWG
ncbi:permease [uncultured Pseudomonas sp.]|uniref:permease n=1 Tax=uncultured Pseudomonas sp. TaxID=114707 RepID=UPI0025D89318|nr:permease [uncultured Pseudomonas sp.]